MASPAQSRLGPGPGEDVLAVVRALAKRRALLDHQAEVARLQALSQARADQIKA
ncbi:MAG: hypothetical protein OJF48_003439 [Afipia sp.]|nr:MAG: hypothetical protein OJF48_003439 [Afipia sp.]